MVEKPFILPQPIQPIRPGQQKKVNAPLQNNNNPFSEVLQKEIGSTAEVKFSRHAQERLDARNIKLEPKHLQRLNEAVEKAQTKGARESLVMLDDLAFVVSIKNKTVITAVDGDSRKGNVFTNIDSAIIN